MQPILLTLAFAAAAATAVDALNPEDPKCVEVNATPAWSVRADLNATTCTSNCSACQWVQGYPQMTYPDYHPTPRTWWAKRIADSGEHHNRLYFGSSPSVRDLKYLYEMGFDAVLSLNSVTTNGLQGKVPLPTTAEARGVAAEAGLLYHSLAADNFSSAAGVTEAANFLDFALANLGQASGSGPIYVHDAGSGADAAAAVQLFRARRSLIQQGSAASVTTKACQEAQNHGIAFSAAIVQALAREANETVAAGTTYNILSATEQATADGSLAAYPWLKYLYNLGAVGVFDAGQIQKYHIEALKAAKIVSIIGMRSGYPSGGNWSGQEPVNLLNVKWGGGSRGIGDPAAYVAPACPAAGCILAPTRPASWACTYPAPVNGTAAYTPCADTLYNFEASNALEWGDAVGQNAHDEGVELEANGIRFFHLPVGGAQVPKVPFTPETFLMYAPQMIEAVNHAAANGGHVLFHCTIGYRTGAFPTALLGLVSNKTNAELMHRMSSIGYDVADRQTGHPFEDGTNVLLGGLHTLVFTGSVNQTTGEINGTVTARAATETTTMTAETTTMTAETTTMTAETTTTATETATLAAENMTTPPPQQPTSSAFSASSAMVFGYVAATSAAFAASW